MSSEFEFSSIAEKVVANKTFTREEAGLFALRAAAEMYRQVFAKCNVPLSPDDDAAFYATMVTAILGGEAVEVRMWRDLLDPEKCYAFNNEMPEAIWEELRTRAKQYLENGEITNTKVIRHLTELSAGKIEVPVYTANWRQWISLNAAILLEEDHFALLGEALQVDKLSPATQNFLRSIKKV